MRTPGQRGAFGNWLQRERTARYKTQADALAAMERLAGLSISPSEYAQWESGSRVPREENPKVARLYDFFGSRPEEPGATTPTIDPTDLVAELREQNAWMRRYVEAMEARVALLEQRAGLMPTPGELAVDQAVTLAAGAKHGTPSRPRPATR